MTASWSDMFVVKRNDVGHYTRGPDEPELEFARFEEQSNWLGVPYGRRPHGYMWEIYFVARLVAR